MQPLQTLFPMSSFSSLGTLTFWAWRREVLAALECSDIPKQQWPQIILQHVIPPALNNITAASKGDVDLLLHDLCINHGDPNTTVATLFREHMDLGPVPDPAIYMKAALNLAKLHGEVLDRSVALLQCPDTPGASNSVYSDGFCGMLVGLLPQGIR